LLAEWSKPEVIVLGLAAVTSIITSIILIYHLREFTKQTAITKAQFIGTTNQMLVRFNELRRILKKYANLERLPSDLLDEKLQCDLRDYAVIFESLIPAIRSNLISEKTFYVYFGARFGEFYHHSITQSALKYEEFKDMRGNLLFLDGLVLKHSGTTDDTK
jgi:hypothetical protein